MKTPLAIVFAGAMIALVLVFSGRYEIVMARGMAWYRLDRLTGQVDLCFTIRGPDANGEIVTSGSQCSPL